MIHILVMATLVSTGAEVQVQHLDGAVERGRLVSLEPDQLSIEIDGVATPIPFSRVLRIVPKQEASPPKDVPQVWVALRDGSRVVGTAYRQSDGLARVVLLGGETLELPTKTVRSVRLHAPAPDLQTQWEGIVAREMKGDAVIVRHPGPSLDYVEGTLGTVTDDKVQFTFDGESASVPRARLEGFLYYTPSHDDAARVICRVADVWGNQWNAVGLKLIGNELRIQAAADVSVALPLEQMAELDFAGENIVYLSDLEPLTLQWTPFLASRTVSTDLSRLFQPRRDRSFSGDKLRLRSSGDTTRVQEYEKGLALHSRTEIVYRLPEGFRRMKAVVGLDGAAGANGSVQLTISGDGQTLLNTAITGQDNPRPLDIDVAGIRRLTILVDFSDGLAIADQLDLCNLRITK